MIEEKTYERDINNLDKRISDIHSYIKNSFTLFSIITTTVIVALSIFGSIQFANEKSDLREYIKIIDRKLNEIKETKTDASIFYDKKLSTIHNTTIIPELYIEHDKSTNIKQLKGRFYPVVKNTGNIRITNLNIKFYTNNPLGNSFPSSDELGYENEVTFVQFKNYFPVKSASAFEIRFDIRPKALKSYTKETTKVKLKIYFDDEPPKDYTFDIYLDRQLISKMLKKMDDNE